jgi:hypothetical protein
VLSAVALLGVPVLAKSLLVLVIAGHGLGRRLRPTPVLVCRIDGCWAVPDRGIDDLSLGARTRYTRLWVHLVLESRTAALDILLLADQLDPEPWRELQARLRGHRSLAAMRRPRHLEPGSRGDLR